MDLNTADLADDPDIPARPAAATDGNHESHGFNECRGASCQLALAIDPAVVVSDVEWKLFRSASNVRSTPIENESSAKPKHSKEHDQPSIMQRSSDLCGGRTGSPSYSPSLRRGSSETFREVQASCVIQNLRSVQNFKSSVA
jgi:hypothetical protein